MVGKRSKHGRINGREIKCGKRCKRERGEREYYMNMEEGCLSLRGQRNEGEEGDMRGSEEGW